MRGLQYQPYAPARPTWAPFHPETLADIRGVSIKTLPAAAGVRESYVQQPAVLQGNDDVVKELMEGAFLADPAVSFALDDNGNVVLFNLA